MTLKTEATYPTRRAYVLKVRGDAKPGALAGRLENLVTGRQRDFSNGGELLDSIASDLEAGANLGPLDPTPAQAEASPPSRIRGSDGQSE